MEEKTAGKSVLIAMTGGVESTVAAYLLKKQGFKPIGIALQLFEPDFDAGPFSEMIVPDLNKVKNICTYLDIPFYAINAIDMFKDQIVDPAVGRVLSGQTFEPIVYYMKLVIEVMMEKGSKFNTNLVATGHYAKVLKNQKSGNYEILVANDIEFDQSYVLSRLENQHLKNLILPLSEIRKVEVHKIGELLKVEYLTRDKRNRAHLMQDPRMVKFVEQNSPSDLRREGSLYNYSKDTTICEHKGVHHFYIGKKNIEIKPEIKIEPELQVVKIVTYKSNVFLDYPNKLKYKHALVVKFISVPETDVSKPISCYAKLGPKEQKLSCKIYFKNNNIVFVEFDEIQKGLLVAGMYVVFYSRIAEKGKIIGSGMIETGGNFDKFEFHTLPKVKEGAEDEDSNIIYPIMDKPNF
jgi:tRNA-specific 2-thiouridylase